MEKPIEYAIWICPYCEENETRKDFLCDECAKKLADEADGIDHVNRCEW